MFHILSIEGSVFNVPLESLREREELKRIERGAPARKVAGGEERGEAAGGRLPTYAERAYREAIALRDEREPLLHAHEIMSRPVITVSPDLKVDDGWRFLRRSGVRHLPVVAGAAVVGIVSERDLLKQLIVFEGSVTYDTGRRIADVMSRPVVSASPETDIRRIARAMFETHIGTMPVLGADRLLAGIVTRSDILYALIHRGPLRLWA